MGKQLEKVVRAGNGNELQDDKTLRGEQNCRNGFILQDMSGFGKQK